MAGSSGAPGGIFISYRRQETAYPAGWLYDRLRDRFGTGQIFKDVDNIEPGDDFVEKITTAVGACDVLLALIGGEWLTMIDEEGRRRLDDPEDFVRLEIEAALAREVRVIPILIDGARMPRAAQLPEALAPLVRRHALELSPSRFDGDTHRLLGVLERTLAEVQAVREAEARAALDAEQRDAERDAREAEERRRRGEAAVRQAREAAQEAAVRERDARPDRVAPARPSPAQPHGGDVTRTRTIARIPGLPRLAAGRRRWIGGGALALLLGGGAVGTAQLASLWDPATTPPTSPSASASQPSASGSSPTASTPAVALPQSARALADDVIVWPRSRKSNWDIALVDVRGTTEKRLTTGPEEDSSPVISHDRRTVIYRRPSKTGSTLRVVSADGKQDRPLFAKPPPGCTSPGRPAWRADGLLAVACTDSSSHDASLNLVTLDGTLVRQLDRGKLGDPSFTPDGKFVLYWRNRSSGDGDGGALYRVLTDRASTPRRLTDGGNGQDADPVCSPDGDLVAFRRDSDELRSIATIKFDGEPRSKPQLLTSGRLNDQDPSWSPDGTQIAFKRGPNTRADLWVMDAGGANARRVVENAEGDTAPAWTTR